MNDNQSHKLYKNPRFLLIFLLVLFFLKGLVFVSIFPVFQGPDEATHYATTQYHAESSQKDWPIKTLSGKEFRNDPSKIDTYNYSEELKKIANSASFDEIKMHRSNIQNFTENSYGAYEKELDKNQWKKYIDVYPPNISGDSKLYFYLTSTIEKKFSSQNILVRFFSIRIFSVILGTLIILLFYLIGKKIGLSENNSLLLSGIIAFQPMFSFLSSIINPDVLLFFDFTLFTFGAVSIIKDGLKLGNFFILLLSTILAVFTKGPGIILIIASYFVITFAIYRKTTISKQKFVLYFLFVSLFLIIVSLFFIIPHTNFSTIFDLQTGSKFSSLNSSLLAYLNKTLEISDLKETAGSYWGSFGWLDHKIPGNVVNFFMFLEFISIALVFLYIFNFIKSGKFTPQKKFLVFFIGMILLLHSIIRFYDWRIFNLTKEILIGTPGRYFMPNIAGHFFLLFSGISILIKQERYFAIFLKIGLIAMIILNFYSIFNLIIPRYYL